jgi:transcription antitermination factor NusG
MLSDLRNSPADKTIGDLSTWHATDMPWYAVRVRARAEERIAALIGARSHGVYLPTYIEKRQYSDRVKKARVPLFTGYVFCSLDIRYRLTILTVPGVLGFVSFEGEPTPVRENELSALVTALASGLGVHPCKYLKAGDRALVVVGPMRGVEGVLAREKGQDRLIISVHLLQRSVAVEVERDWLMPL